jgi:lipid A 4'-phosphatase
MNADAQARPMSASARWALPLLLILAYFAVTLVFDLRLSAAFYRPGEGFFLGDLLPLRLIYRCTFWYIKAVIIVLLGCLAYTCLPPAKWNPAWRGRVGFLLLSLAIGPGLITHTLFKDHWGRPRPEHLVEFGGHSHYVLPLVPSAQCDRNCSFPSGHAAAGFWLISGGWVWTRHRRRWLAAGLALGTVISLTRIVQGGHFLSDVLAALAVVWMVNAALSRWMSRQGWLIPA